MTYLRRHFRPRVFPVVFGLMLAAMSLFSQVTVQIGQNFTATAEDPNNPILPPDPDGTIGPQYFVEFINGSFTVFNRTNGQSIRRITDLEFWTDAGVNISADATVSDPRIIFDPISRRWFASQVDTTIASDDPTVYANHFLLAVSKTSSPVPDSGAWQGFKFTADPDLGYFADFPTLGIDSNAVYLSGDFYNGDTNEVGPGLVSIPKADLLAATPTIANRTWFGVMDYAVRGQVMQPATCFDGSESGSVLAMGDIGTTSDFYSNLVWSAVQNSGTTNATLSTPVSLTVDSYQVPDNDILGVPAFVAPQPDDAQYAGEPSLQANDPRISARVYAVGGVLYAVHNTELNGRMAIQWYRIRASDQTLLEQGAISDSNLDLFMPSIAANQHGAVVIACNGSSSSSYVSCYAYAGLTVNGHTTFGNAILLKAGVVSYHDVDEILYEQFLGMPWISRWGDYSTLSVDPADPTQFWSEQMYPSGLDESSGLGDGIWSTEITQLFVTVAPPPLAFSLSPTNLALSWPAYAADFQLQSTTNLTAGAGWLPVTQTPSTNGNTISVVIPKSGPQAFFRLEQGQ
jgi:hypothetical protein